MSKQYGRIPLWQLTPKELAKWRSVYAPKEDDTSIPPATATGDTATPPPAVVTARGLPDARGLTCGTCRLEFDDVKAQQTHFKSDFHVYNLKRKSKGLDCVGESDFDAYVVASAAARQRRASADASDETSDDRHASSVHHPLDLSWSSSSDEDSDTDDTSTSATIKEPLQAYTDATSVFKIYNAAFPDYSDKSKDAYVATLESVQSLASSSFQWAVLLFRAGRFAGGVFRKDKVLVHKCFERYTTRRKQGGSQSAHDSAGGKAKSAGAQLRRYNEMALTHDISDLLTKWGPELDGCDRIFLGVAKTSRGIFFDKTGLTTGDPRLRSVPFGTLRPTYDEVCRVRGVLASAQFSPFREFEVKVSTPTTTKPKKVTAVVMPPPTTTAPVEPAPPAPMPPPPLVAAVDAHDIDAIEALLATTEANVNATDGTLRTALHVAAQHNLIDVLERLLAAGADPCMGDDHQRVPYFFASTKDARNVFRRFRGAAPDRWDYDAAKIPAALTDEMEEAAKAREKEKKKRAKERKKEAKAAEDQLKREQDAAAAEAAARRAKELACAMCGEPSGAKPFVRLEFKYCSTKCVNDHKRQLMADAAIKRFGQ
ncbi:Aste57867_21144 [Aphanomyces stellatus]|uniref:Aste57867_21144 protein n=1 Tax=Aphanomyces stellatus TaxID=120398 RepID=A0A485LI13_9STRA|nr:hypothetical protein As57867_021076 [Aphanomyces stellatus]VFT97818.1 Aste57867_21144 [Aphanomyces stellatus]